VATIPGIGVPCPSYLTRRVQTAIHDVAEEMTLWGYGRPCILHGSAVTGQLTFIDGVGDPVFAGDLDIVVSCKLSHTEREALGDQLTSRFRTTLGTLAGPLSCVSMKVLNTALLATDEAPSLLRSIRAAGCAASAFGMSGCSRILQLGKLEYPFALPYGLARCLQLMRGSADDRVVAVYELVKAITRHEGPRAHGRAASYLVQAEDLRRYALKSMASPQPHVPLVIRTALSTWLGTREWLTCAGDAAVVARASHALHCDALARWPRSILVSRLDRCARRSAA